MSTYVKHDSRWIACYFDATKVPTILALPCLFMTNTNMIVIEFWCDIQLKTKKFAIINKMAIQESAGIKCFLRWTLAETSLAGLLKSNQQK